ncbi:MAG: PIN domain-containing protein [Clostridia bacterium]|nr:PIN domain-containing protein [Clostridia bacterium]
MGAWSPIDAVIVDTSAYHKEQCDFIGVYNKILLAFFDLLKERKIILLSHPVLQGEIKKHIGESELISKLSNLKVLLRKYKDVFSLVNCSADEITASIDDLNLHSKLTEAFELEYKKAVELPYPDVEKIFEQYFATEPPFSSSGNKKKRVP